MSDYIDGHPDVMRAYAAQGPGDTPLGAPGALHSRMDPDGTGMVTADREATARLLAFVTEANTRVDGLTRGAQTSGAIYLDAEQANQATISAVVTG